MLRFFHAFEPNDPKVTINLDEFPLILESTVQQSPIQTFQPNLLFYWNEILDSTLIDILKNNWNLLLDYVVSIFNTSCNTSITKKQIKFYIQYVQHKFTNLQILLVMKFYFH